MNIAERIHFLRGKQTRETFAEGTGVSAQTIYKYEKKLGTPTIEFVDLLCKKLQLNHQWLISGEGPMQAQHPATPTPLITPASHVQTGVINNLVVTIPIIEPVLAADGKPVVASGDSAWIFRRDVLEKKGTIENMLLMRVSGDSMAPDLYDGDIVLIDQQKTALVPGRLYAIGVEDMIYIKRVDAVPGKLILQSANPSYAALEVNTRSDPLDCLRVIGRILWSSREYR